MRTIRRRDDRGASAVEFALVLPVLLLVLFGMISAGFMFNDHLSVTNAIREGARTGASLKFTNADWATSVRDRVRQTYFNDVDKGTSRDLTNDNICVKLVNSSHTLVTGSNSWTGSKCGTPPDLSGFTMPSGTCAVVVWASKPRTIELLVAPDLRMNVHAKSVSSYGQTVTPCTAS
jgi:Flp pilus assembly protein TadG